jgi:hypothetical protein
MAANNVALRKRAQIAKANRAMFLWIAVSSVIVGASIVVSVFLFQDLVYNQKVINKKNETVGILEKNNKAVPDLQAAVRVLDTSTALASVKANPTDQTLQVVLDALPADANSLALGASLQNKLLANIPGLRLTSLQVTPVSGVETGVSDAVDTTVTTTATETQDAVPIDFQFTVTGNQAALKQVLVNMQKSLRIIDIRNLTISAADGGELTLLVNGRSFYVPAKEVTLTKETVER